MKDVVSTEEDLLPLQLRIARRADELAQLRSEHSAGDDRECWLQAERELLLEARRL